MITKWLTKETFSANIGFGHSKSGFRYQEVRGGYGLHSRHPKQALRRRNHLNRINNTIRKIIFVVILSTMVFALIIPVSAAMTDGIFVTTEDTKLRSAPTIASPAVSDISTGTRVALLSHDPAGWSRVSVSGSEGFIRSDVLTFPAENAPVTFRTTAVANMRAQASGDAEVFRTLYQGTEVEVLRHNPAGWASISANGTVGFVRSDILQAVILGTQEITSTPVTMQTVNTLQTIDATGIKAGPSDDADVVYNMETGTTVEVIGNLPGGWSEVRVNGADGYVKTELLGTRPGNVELLTFRQWRPLVNYREDIKITDVRTGRSFNIQGFATSGHFDVETSTQADTDIMFEVFGNKWSWATRPVWVHVDGRTFAAAIHGMPHPADWIADNGMDGHVCLHFHGTITRNPRFQADLRSSVMEAFKAGQG